LLYGLNFFGMAFTSSGVSSVIALTMQASGGLPGARATFRFQSSFEQMLFVPLNLVMRCGLMPFNAEHDPAISKRKYLLEPTRMNIVLSSGAFQVWNWFMKKHEFEGGADAGCADAAGAPNTMAVVNA